MLPVFEHRLLRLRHGMLRLRHGMLRVRDDVLCTRDDVLHGHLHVRRGVDRGFARSLNCRA
ncbi:MAG: hypothetical protein JO325_09950, partial [Solirubrobacterales bacterium]|nr:hypothetical protein [Solirubrobacterales bacterium]